MNKEFNFDEDIDSGKREKCKNCGEEVIVWQNKGKFFVGECECHKKVRLDLEEKEKIIEKANFSKKCQKLFPFLECDPDIKSHTFENFEVNDMNKEAFEETKKATFGYFSKFGINLVGSFGSGKTRLAKTKGYEKYKKGEDVIFVEYSEIFDRIFATYKSSKETESELMYCLLNVKNLTIDELGVGSNSPAKEDLFLKIINGRKKKGLSTDFTMNEDGKKQLSGRINSRLVEYAKTIINNAPDYRLKAMLKNIKQEEKLNK